MTRLGLIAISAGAIALSGCQYIPGTGAYQESKAKEAVAQALIDPDSAQFRNVESRDQAVCGEVNGKNRMGAYVGFVRFYVETTGWTATLDPQFDPQSLASARSLCALSRYDASTCAREMEEMQSQARQAAFDAYWGRHCGARPAPAVRVPFDPTRSNGLEDLNLAMENAASPSPTADPEGMDVGIDGASQGFAGNEASLSLPSSELDAGRLNEAINRAEGE